MTKDRKPTRTDLLDELSSIQSLLGDAARDVDQPLLEDEIPVLPPDDADGDTHTQIPLLGAEAPRSTSADPLRKALSERENPFLPKSASTPKPQPSLAGSKAIEAQIAQRAASMPPRPTQAAPIAPAGGLGDSEIHALVDEVLAEWLPKIERDLRNRLIDALKNRS